MIYRPKISKSLAARVHKYQMFVEGWCTVCEGEVYEYRKRKSGGWRFYKLPKKDPRRPFIYFEDWYNTLGAQELDKIRAKRKKAKKKK